jgi:hypothetical protein
VSSLAAEQIGVQEAVTAVEVDGAARVTWAVIDHAVNRAWQEAADSGSEGFSVASVGRLYLRGGTGGSRNIKMI